MIRFLSLACFAVLSLSELGHASDLALELPRAATESAHREDPASALILPVSAYRDETTKTVTLKGDLDHRAYRLPGAALTSFQMLEPMQTQLDEAGFQTLFACADSVCGGFDFRYLLDLLPEPAMHVDLGDFQYLVAKHQDGRGIAIVTSRAPSTGFIQITHITPSNAAPITVSAPKAPETPDETPFDSANSTAFSDALTLDGHRVLDDLAFDTGSTALGEGPFGSLEALAQFLLTTPNAQIVLVGHTDAVGSLEANIALSRKRAAAVRDRLVSTYGIPSAQLSAKGIGFLSPRTTNQTKEGRAQNRRVEAVLASTQ